MRPDKDSYYLDIAEAVLERSTCLRRKYGAVIVKDDEIIATGYNGAPRGEVNCCDIGYCEREQLQIQHGERYEKCRAVHAEMNAIISAPRHEMIGAILYLAGKEADGSPIYDAKPCLMCERLIVNAGIKRVISRKENCMTELLKPCPFCGSKARLMAMGYGDKKLYGIFCTTDLKQEYQHGHFIDNYSDKEEAITAWNTRANEYDKDKKGGDNP